MNLKIVETACDCCSRTKYDRVGRQLNVPADILGRHPFPGPGLRHPYPRRSDGRESPYPARSRIKSLSDGLKESGLYDQVWQAGVMLLPVQSVGVMGDERTI